MPATTARATRRQTGEATTEEQAIARRTLPLNGDAPGVDPDLWLLHVQYASRGTADLRNLLVEEYQGYALAMARRMHRDGEPIEDLRQVAFEALLLALERFDPRRGCPFLGFASLTINGALKRHYRDYGWLLRVPRRVHELAAPIRRVTDTLTMELGRTPTLTELAAALEIDVETLLEAQEADHARTIGPLSVLAPSDTGFERETIGKVDPGFDQSVDHVDLRRALADLDDDERDLVRRYYFEERTQNEIAADLGVSQMQVSRLLDSITRRLAAKVGAVAS
ncbi:MAG TPA: sigma-70 family RNA polymerase sigma factor [Acidimicrobiales bacterium]|nr:sigma-70 family RNA polymerase sigma factor [Acidimicrobiales bacterium]